MGGLFSSNNIKVIVLGEYGVGKTSFISQITKDKSTEKKRYKELNIKHQYEGKEYDLHLHFYDTAGEEKFHSVPNIYYKGAKVVLYFYAVNDKKSFDELKYWASEVKNRLDANKTVFSVIGTKSDLGNEEVNQEDAKDFASENLSYLFINSIHNQNEEALNTFIKKILDENFFITYERQKMKEELKTTKDLTPEEKKNINLDEYMMTIRTIQHSNKKGGCCGVNKKGKISNHNVWKKKNIKRFFYNIVLLGSQQTGKTQILNNILGLRYMEDSYLPTIGIEKSNLMVNLSDGSSFKLIFIDTAGQERYRSMVLNYCRQADALLFVYSVNDMKSLDELSFFYESTKEVVNFDSVIFFGVIANKCDLNEEKIYIEKGKLFAEKNGMNFYEYSSKENRGWELIKKDIIESIEKNKEKFNFGNDNLSDD